MRQFYDLEAIRTDKVPTTVFPDELLSYAFRRNPEDSDIQVEKNVPWLM